MSGSCADFERWLDDALSAAGAGQAHAHAAGCARCAALLELERVLAAPPSAVAPAAFTHAVLDRVRAADRSRSLAAAAMAAEEPWWLAVTLQPAVLLALVAAAVLAVTAGPLWGVMLRTGAAIAAWASPLLAAGSAALGSAPAALLPGGADSPLAGPAWLALCLSLGLVLAWPLFRWSERLVSGTLPRLAARP